jgi:hypothetical protein
MGNPRHRRKGVLKKKFYLFLCYRVIVYFRKKDHMMLSSARQASIQGSQRFICPSVQKPFSFKNSCGTEVIGNLLRPFWLCITFKGDGICVANTNHLINRRI